MTFEESKQRKVARILVNLKIREGLGKRFISVGEATPTFRNWIMKISLLGVGDATNMDI